jgi:hypothetical protein
MGPAPWTTPALQSKSATLSSPRSETIEPWSRSGRLFRRLVAHAAAREMCGRHASLLASSYDSWASIAIVA